VVDEGRSLTPNDAVPARGESATYWLRRCHGFRVESDRGRIGVVEDVLYGAEPARPAALVVRRGVLRQRVDVIPLEDVEAIYPRLERLVVRKVGECPAAREGR
jgi:hypothetical protein